MNKLTDADIAILSSRINASPYRNIVLFMLESHLPLKNLLLFGMDFTAPLFSLLKPKEIDLMRALLAEPEGLQRLIAKLDP